MSEIKKRILSILTLALAGFIHSTSAFECDAEMQRDIDFAVNQLRGLSDSGVYETLELVDVKSAERTRGMYHDVLNFSCVLDSPHMVHRFAVHRMFLMTAFDDASKSIAIDVYPEMRPESIQTFMQRKVQRAREERELALQQLERSAMALEKSHSVATSFEV